MIIEHTHNTNSDFYTDGIHDEEFQDAEIIDEEHDSNPVHQEVNEEPLVVEPENSVEENIDLRDNTLEPDFSGKQFDNTAEADEAISILEAELHKEKDKFTRLFAEFENYKKRTTRERIELFKSAGQDVIQAMLPILDDFDRALVEISKSGDENLLKGVELIHSKFFKTLQSKGLEEIKVSVSDPFDSEIHEAITQVAAPSPELKGKIIDVIEKGYKLGGKIIRYPKVVVGQ
ncbi:nucleotide exchange factor GrpE [Capnocytophaga sp. oral taxon 338]|uniref:nucleotide exchange factor GrpE n=1 Tax=Capnocytophaga sp. oral taxon 338 TaxID=710239 RepID=UPI000202ED1D|nr:nucleotide exchange factor GrpE [Capnocytophaga sp. oral taxon 338]EGD34216.1 chaperone GrpE [Capnocytophaga sp. oral taxon 338 str. F0234]